LLFRPNNEIAVRPDLVDMRCIVSSLGETIFMAWKPPHKRDGYVPQAIVPDTNYTADGVADVFKVRGWVRGAGGDLYFNGNRTTDHPHLHLKLNTGIKIALNGDVRGAVNMLAWSDGGQGMGGGGRTFVAGGALKANADTQIGLCNLNAAMANEVAFIRNGLPG
jgi:hypothetical protein